MKKNYFIIFCFFVVSSICGCQNSSNSVSNATTSTNTATSELSDINVETNNNLTNNFNLIYCGSVNNDTTGNWRYSEYSSSTTSENLALDYYNTFFESDKEIHCLINTSLKTSSSISLLTDNILDVRVYDYVDGEEFDANLMFSGTYLKEYWIYIDTGEIEDITNE